MIQEPQVRFPGASGVEMTISRLVDVARADAVFGKPIERGEVTIIPCSEVAVGMGMGRGIAPRLGADGKEQEGAGGGGGARGRPVAAIIIKGSEVRVKPILDITKMVLTVFATTGSILLWVGLFSRPTRAAWPMRGLSPRRVNKSIRRGMLLRRPGRANLIRLTLARLSGVV